MKIMSRDTLKELVGAFILLYGGTGVGKSVSTIQSCPDKLLWMLSEARSTHRMLRAANRPDLHYDVALYEGWNPFIAFNANFKNFEKYDTVFLDSASHLMNIRLAGEIMGENFDALPDKDRGIKSISKVAKMSQEAWGVLATQMNRLSNLHMKLANEEGKTVIWSALEISAPKWDRALIGAPGFGGQMYNRDFPGFFDLIGRVEQRVNDDGEIVYPPMVYFESPNGDFTAKATGDMETTSSPLDWTKILNL